MPICTGCGAASAGWARSCAACGRTFPPARSDDGHRAGAAGRIGEIGEVGEAVETAPDGRWGLGVPYRPERPWAAAGSRLLADWLPALKAVAAPTGLLVAAAVLLALPEHLLWPVTAEYGDRLRASLALVLTAFGAPLRLQAGPGADLWTPGPGLQLRVVPLLVGAGWLALLGLGLRARRRANGPADAGSVLAESARTAAAAAAGALLLGAVGRVTLLPKGAGPQEGGATVEPGLLTAAAGAALAAALLAAAVHGSGPVRAWFARHAVLHGLPGAARATGLALAGTLGAAGAAVLVLAAVLPQAPPVWVCLPLAVNGGLFLLALGSGAVLQFRDRGPGAGWERELSLFDPDGTAGPWPWAVLLAAAGALLLARSVHRQRLGPADRLTAAALYACALTALDAVAGLSVRSAAAPGGDAGASWAIAADTALIAHLLWAAVGALLLPPIFARLRPAHGEPPAPAHGPADTPPPLGPAVPFGGEVLDSHRDRHRT
ncbi:hypothetical protein [Kitasatospora sp. KL5]|uniref:hypothetical protein n=1 Tax=Kitasatospora sp. KL5 TaxID=3425125 RepID=UPI003D6FB80C